MMRPNTELACAPLRRGDRHRRDIVQAVRDLVADGSIAELTVSAISKRAGLSRSNFYFYFDSKYAVLALIFAEGLAELQGLTRDFAPRGEDESPRSFVSRMIADTAAVYASQGSAFSACTLERNSDPELQAVLAHQGDAVINRVVATLRREVADGRARPVSDDLQMLVRILIVTTSSMLAGDFAYLEDDGDQLRAVKVLEDLWLNALWSWGRRHQSP